MKKAQLIGLAVAGIAGFAAFVMMKGIVNQKPTTKTMPVFVDATEVMVAAKDIGLGEMVSEQHFTWQKWPKDGLRPGLITKDRGNPEHELAGSIARAPLLAGEPVTPMKLIKAGQGGVLSAILPAGMRAVSTRIEQKTAVGGLVLPNDHVDVILIRRQRSKSGNEEYVSDTLFRNVRVLAIGQQIEAAAGEKAASGTNSTTTATLEMTPRQAELLALANSMGEITLSLRSVADLNSEGQNLGGDEFGNKERTETIRVLRYGVKSRAYGVN
ncbi:MAG: Flp pilus assembly protein CpaB [Hyphomicrobiaceae bacterium]|nr:Flp pilus assembly protein CpaB [Hyphomicrobiaceae bacterium]